MKSRRIRISPSKAARSGNRCLLAREAGRFVAAAIVLVRFSWEVMLAWLSLLIGQQVLSRSLTFALNVVITRVLDVEQLGATMGLALVESTILFISREPLRRIAIRHGDLNYAQSCINCCWMVSIPLAGLVTWTMMYLNSSSMSPEAHYCLSIFTFGLLVDLISEPFYLSSSIKSRIPLRVAFESISTIARVIITFLLVLPPISMGIVAYGWAQLGSALIKLLLFAVDALRRYSAESLPMRLPSGRWVDASVWGLGGMFTLQSFEKYLLTEGEKLALVLISRDYRAQGVYGIVQNLGSLIARFLFQPIEEVAALYFSKELLSKPKVYMSITSLLKLMVLIGLLGLTFGPPFSFIVIHFLYGSGWSQDTDAAHVLSMYCIYIFFMAVNGVTEALMFSVVSEQQLKSYNIVLIPFSIMHILVSFTLVPFGSGGLILANSISMGCRIGYSLIFIKEYIQMQWLPILLPIVPDKIVAIVLALSAAVLTISGHMLNIVSEPSLISMSIEIATGLVCLSAFAVSVFLREKDFINKCLEVVGKDRRPAGKSS